MDRQALTDQLKQQARSLGFSLAGVCPAVSPLGLVHFDEWLARGYAGEMHYLRDRRESYEHPRHVLDGVRSIVMLAMNYRTAEPAMPTPGQGRVARYAWGTSDYHDLIHERLHRLADWLREGHPGASVRGVVDTAPLMERDLAQLAGLGWIGKNTLLLNRDAGSYFFLAALLTNLELTIDSPHTADHCGTCTACLDACPTDAFPQPYLLDASRCISYLTIEHRSQIPEELRPGIGNWLFGCDVCQEVCPWNSRTPQSELVEFTPTPDSNPADAVALFDLDDDAFREKFRHTPLWRSKRRGLLRNAAIVLGNHPIAAGVAALAHGLHDAESLVRGGCAWALGNYDAADARPLLESQRDCETEPEVRQEINAALVRLAHEPAFQPTPLR
ncbi:MAG: tRNA epoxyqueuosine(34) reductase QueG [Pirellulales bacterium]